VGAVQIIPASGAGIIIIASSGPGRKGLRCLMRYIAAIAPLKEEGGTYKPIRTNLFLTAVSVP
jgi:hypothetical protein